MGHSFYPQQATRHEVDELHKAKRLALIAHAGVFYQPENIPYSTHLYKVERILTEAHTPSAFELRFAITIGWLHDVVEDTLFRINDLENDFSSLICSGVLALTKNKTLCKADQMTDSLSRIILQPKEVAVVKMADRIANLTNTQAGWSNSRKWYYCQEAVLIHNTLSYADKSMSENLMNTIQWYRTTLLTNNC